MLKLSSCGGGGGLRCLYILRIMPISVRHPLHFALFDCFIWVLLLTVSGCVTGKIFAVSPFRDLFPSPSINCVFLVSWSSERCERAPTLRPPPLLADDEKRSEKLLVPWSLSGLTHTHTQLGIAYISAAWVISHVSPVLFSHHTVPLKSIKHNQCTLFQTDSCNALSHFSLLLVCFFYSLKLSERKIYTEDWQTICSPLKNK